MRVRVFILVCSALLVTGLALASQDELSALMRLPSSASRSVGGPLDGRLEASVPFPERGPGFERPARRRPEARFGTVEMVRGLVRAAIKVHERLPGGTLVVHDLSLESGGPIARHDSHRAGRDVDVLYFLLDEAGAPTRSVGAILGPDGRGVDFRDLADPSDDVHVQLDVARTWAFLEALALDDEAGLQRVFIAEHLRTLLLRHAERSGGDPHAIARLGDMTCQPSTPHDDHLHLRFFCSPDDLRAGCEDAGPIYPWRRAALKQQGLKPTLNRPRPDRPRSKTVSPAEARAAAGPLHADVVAWLEKRNAWIKPPRTGRRFCP
jgi:penicillin-insensitive murein DD-endopeptidase